MPRRSNAAASTPLPVIDAGSSRLAPPRNLNRDEQQIFRSVVASMPPSHFLRSDIVLLIRYCQDIALASITAEHLKKEGCVDKNGRLSPHLRALEKLDRSIIALSGKLRLAPSARYDARAADRNSRTPEPSYYDLMKSGFDFDDEKEDVDAGRN
jgi:phage terminase small subunit